MTSFTRLLLLILKQQYIFYIFVLVSIFFILIGSNFNSSAVLTIIVTTSIPYSILRALSKTARHIPNPFGITFCLMLPTFIPVLILNAYWFNRIATIDIILYSICYLMAVIFTLLYTVKYAIPRLKTIASDFYNPFLLQRLFRNTMALCLILPPSTLLPFYLAFPIYLLYISVLSFIFIKKNRISEHDV